MANFKPVYWGTDTPMTVDRLNQMVQNDQNNYDIIGPKPRGVLVWRSAGPYTVNTTAPKKLDSIPFSCEESRRLRIGVSYRTLVTNAGAGQNKVAIGLYVDNIQKNGMISQELIFSRFYPSAMFETIITDLPAGPHTFDLYGSLINSNFTASIGDANPYSFVHMYVEDMGALV